MPNHERRFALLERYLKALNLERVARIEFGVEALCQRRGFDEERVDPVIDDTACPTEPAGVDRLAPHAFSTRGASGPKSSGTGSGKATYRLLKIKVPQYENVPSKGSGSAHRSENLLDELGARRRLNPEPLWE